MYTYRAKTLEQSYANLLYIKNNFYYNLDKYNEIYHEIQQTYYFDARDKQWDLLFLGDAVNSFSNRIFQNLGECLNNLFPNTMNKKSYLERKFKNNGYTYVNGLNKLYNNNSITLTEKTTLIEFRETRNEGIHTSFLIFNKFIFQKHHLLFKLINITVSLLRNKIDEIKANSFYNNVDSTYNKSIDDCFADPSCYRNSNYRNNNFCNIDWKNTTY